MLRDSVVVVRRRCHRRRRAYAPTGNTARHDNHEKIKSWLSFSFLYEYGAPFEALSGRRSSAITAYLKITIINKW